MSSFRTRPPASRRRARPARTGRWRARALSALAAALLAAPAAGAQERVPCTGRCAATADVRERDKGGDKERARQDAQRRAVLRDLERDAASLRRELVRLRRSSLDERTQRALRLADSALAALPAKDGRSARALARAELGLARSAAREPKVQDHLRDAARTLSSMQARLAQLDQARSKERALAMVHPRAVEPAGWMGITHSGSVMLTDDDGTLLLTHHGYPLVESVEPGSPAEAAGIAAGDTIVAYNGRDVRAEAVSLTSLLTPGKRVMVKVRREGRTKAIPVTIARRPRREEGMWTTVVPLPPMAPAAPMPPTVERVPRPPRPEVARVRDAVPIAPPTPRAPAAPPAPSAYVFRWGTNAVAGAEVVAMNDDLREAFGGRRGLLVIGVAEGSPAHEAGLRGGDVIVRAGGDSVATPGALRSAMRAVKKGRALEMDVVRKGKARVVELRWSAASGRAPR